jgi:GT2 family glycosyltransferase
LREFNVIIIDNGNAEDYQISRISNYLNVSYVASPSNMGFAAGNNRGLELASNASWIILLNPDTLPAVDWFERMIKASVHYPEFAFFGSKLLNLDRPTILDGEGDCYSISGMAWRSGMGQLSVNDKASDPWEVFSPCAAAALYNADALRRVGGFDEDFFCYMEDVDLGFRLRLAGYRCLMVSAAEVLHVGSATTVKRSPFYIYYGQRNLVWTYVKNMPGILFWLFLPLHLALNIIAVLRYAISGDVKVVCRAKYDAVRMLPKMWLKRKEIQKARRVSIKEVLNVLDKRAIPGLGRAFNSLWK